FRLVVLAAGGSTTVSATIGVTTLWWAGYANWADFGPIWLTWWLGDAVGDLIIAPALMVWWEGRPAPELRTAWEAVGVALGLIGVGILVFSAGSPIAVRHYPLEF